MFQSSFRIPTELKTALSDPDIDLKTILTLESRIKALESVREELR